MSELDGQCHCGNIRCRYTLPADTLLTTVRECGCAFCRKHGAVWTSEPSAALHLTLRDPDGVIHHRFATATAEFLICATCGILVAAISEIDGNRHAVLNANILEDFDPREHEIQTMDYDGESVPERLARRRKRWIADVRWDT